MPDPNMDPAVSKQIADAVAAHLSSENDKERKPRPKLSSIAIYLVPVIVLILGFYHDHVGMMSHAWDVVTSLAVLFLAVASVLALASFIQIWRESKFFDKQGVASEMHTVQDRIGTDEEEPSDALSIGTKHAGMSIMIGLLVLSYVLLPS